MTATRFCLVAIVIWQIAAGSMLWAQGGGGYGGSEASSNRADRQTGSGGTGAGELSWLSPEQVLNAISVQGSAEIRVPPEKVRVVLAVLSAATTAQESQTENARRVQAVREQWKAAGIPEGDMAEDFIAVLPQYTWKQEQLEGTPSLVQRLTGYRMQTNLHVSVKSEAAAMEAVRMAFSQGVSDIITFEYSSSQLDKKKKESRELALNAAKEKAALLLSIFNAPPPVINVEERTEIIWPQSQYITFSNDLQETVDYNFNRNLPQIRAIRPQMTFYKGLTSPADVRPETVSLQPEIAVVSTVRIYYQSPATKQLSNLRITN